MKHNAMVATTVPRLKPVVWQIRQALLPVSACLALASYPALLLAGPDGGVVTGGVGAISQTNATTTINQTSQNMAIDWQSYNLGTNERVQYLQPNQSSISLNNILSNSASQIRGRIDANGQVILVNPNGVFFTPDSVINVGGIIASGLAISRDDFMNGQYIFNQVAGTEGKVINSGTINAALGGNVALIGKQVKNDGLIAANLGSVTLAAGKQAVLSFDGAGLLGVRVSEAILQDELGLDPAVVNSGTITAQAGQVLLTGSVSQTVFSQAVNSGGLEQAHSVVVNEDGSFTLGDGADVVNSGVIDVSNHNTGTTAGRIVMLGENVTSRGQILADAASGNGGNGGEIELHASDTSLLTGNSYTSAQSLADGQGGLIKVLGERVGLFDQSQINASGDLGGGTVLIGGDYQGNNSQIRNAQRTFVGPASRISADALSRGDGGDVIVWADESTQFYGNISAQGGSEAGNGGFAEVSGKQGLIFEGWADLTARHGKAGLLLLDPKDITISSLPTSHSFPSQYNQFDDISSAATVLNNVALANQLRTSIVRLQANTDIFVNADVTRVQAGGTPLVGGAVGGAQQLELNAGRSISIANGVSIELDGAGFVAIVNHSLPNSTDKYRDPGNAAFTMGTGSSIKTNGGRISITTGTESSIGNFTLQSLDASGVAGGGAGNVVITNGYDDDSSNLSGNITLNGPILAQGGVGSADANGGNGGNITITTDKGNINVNGAIASNGGGGGALGVAVGTSGGNAGAIVLTSGSDATNTLALNGDISANGGASVGTGVVGSANSIALNAKKITTSGNRVISAVGGNAVSTGNVTLSSLSGNTHSVNTLALGGGLNLLAGVGGDVNFYSDVNYNGIGSGTLTLSAGNNITAYGNIVDSSVVSADRLNIALNANTDGDSAGNVTLQKWTNANTTITTGGGSFGVTGVNYVADSAAGRIVSVNTGSGGATLNMTGSAQLGRMEIGGDLSVSAGAANGSGISIGQGAANSTSDLLVVTGAATFASNAVGGKINLVNNNLLQSAINLATTGGDQADAVLTNATVTTTLNNASVAGNLTVNAARHLTVTGNVTGKGTNGIAGNSVLTTLTLNFGQNGVPNGAGGTFSYTGTGVIAEGSSATIGDDRVAIVVAGGSGADTFNINNAERISTVNGAVEIDKGISFNGMGGDDIFNISASIKGTMNGGTGADRFNINAFDLTNISINGGADTDTVYGANEENLWQITTANGGTLVTSVDVGGAAVTKIIFSDIENLTGNSGNDTFSFDTAGSISGMIDGGGGAGTNTLNARASGNNTWTMAALNNSIATTGNPSPYLNRFTNMQILNGGAGVDTFDIASHFSGTINGLGGNDVFNLNALGLSVTAMNGGLGINTVRGADETSTWNITAANGGNINNKANFSEIENLTGGSGNDTFNFGAAGAVTGAIDGGAGPGTNILNARASDNTWTLTVANNSIATTDSNNPNPTYLNRFTNIHTLNGGAGVDIFNITSNVGDVINGAGGQDVFNLTASIVNSGALNGGNDDDTFNLNAPGLSVTAMNGGAGSDTLRGAAEDGQWLIDVANGGTLTTTGGNLVNFGAIESVVGNSASGNDTFTLGSGGSIVAIDGGGGNNTLNARASNNTWTIAAVGNAVNHVGSFTNLHTLNGGAGVDTFNISRDFGGVMNGAGGQDVFNLTASIIGTGALNGGDGNDTFNLNAPGLTVATIEGGADSDTVRGANEENTWRITAANTGNINTLAYFSGIENLTGNANDDHFIFTTLAGVDGLINGAGHLAGDSVDLVTLGNVNVVMGTTLLNVERITANGGSTLTGGIGTNNWSITGTHAGVVNGVNFDGFNMLVGGAGQDIFRLNDGVDFAGSLEGAGGNNDTLIGSNRNNGWSIAGVNTGAVTGLTGGFSTIENLTGGSGNDSFTLGAAGSLSGQIDGGLGSNTLIGSNGPNSWNLTGANSGALNAGGFSNIENLTGGSGDDTFTVGAGGSVTGLVDGGAGSNTLNARALGNNTWTISTDGHSIAVSGSPTPYLNRFTNMQILSGGAGVDIFNINRDFGGVMNGAGGQDIFNLTASITGTGALNGDDDNDSFNLNAAGLSVVAINGGAGNDTLRGANDASQWNITQSNGGALITAGTVEAPLSQVSFSAVEKLVGGTADDAFVLQQGVDISGMVLDGGAHVLGDSVDMSRLSGALTILIGATGADNVERLIGNGNGNTTLIGSNNGYSWLITGSGAGTLNPGLADQLIFSGIGKLQGGTGNDSFRFSAPNINFGGSIHGGNGSGVDTIDYSNQIDLVVQVSDALGSSGIDGIEGVRGGINSTLAGANSNSTWTLSGANSGQVVYSNGSQQLSFIDFVNLTGGNKDDQFVFQANSSLSGRIDGGSQTNNGIDTLDMSALDVAKVVLGSGVINVEQITGNNSNSTLTGENNANSWNITGINDGTINNAITFINFNHLRGGNNDDLFIFNSGTDITGLIDGGAHVNGDRVDLSALATVDVVLGVDVNNIETIIGNNNINSRLTGENNSNSWVITGINDGTINNVINFIDFKHLRGGSADDQFIFNAAGQLSGLIDGGGQTTADSINMAALTTVNVVLGRDVVNIEQITGNNNASTLTGENNANTWTLTGENDGEVAGVKFINFNNLVGGNGDDDFIFNAGARLTGRIDGGAHTNQDSVNLSALPAVNLVLGRDVVNVEQITANTIASTLTGENNANNWTLTGANKGNVDGVVFIGFNNLTGGNDDDYFNFNIGGSLSGRIDGGTQTTGDRLSMVALPLVNLALGSDVINVEQITGNNTASTLTGENNANTWTLTGVNQGDVDGVTFIGFNNLTGGSSDDHFIFNTQGRLAGRIDGGAHATQDTLNMVALNVVDVVLGENVINIEQLTGNNSNSTLSGANNPNLWTLTETNGGNVNGVRFVGFNHLVGGNNDDRFVFNAGSRLNGSIDGAGQVEQDAVDMAALGVVNVVLGKDVRNIELITGNNTNSTLTGMNNPNLWTINGENDGEVNGLLFNNFNHLTGGNLDDNFVFGANGVLTGRIDGGDNFTLDTVDMAALASVDVVLGTGLVNVEKIIGNHQASTLTATDAINQWTINGLNEGNLAANGEVLLFTGFNRLVGGRNADHFDVLSTGKMNGTIIANAGDDTLSIALINIQNGQLAFSGGEGRDTVRLTGGGSGYQASYNASSAGGEFSYINADNRYAIALNSVEAIRDDVIADLRVIGTSANDTFVLDNGKFVVNALTPVDYSNKHNVSFDGAGGEADIISLNSDITVSGLISLSAETIVNNSASTLTANGLTLNAVASAGTPSNRILTDVDNLYLTNSGAVYINNTGNLNLAQMDASGAVDIEVDGNLRSSAKLTSNAALTLAATGDIELNHRDNALAGPLDLKATQGTITVNNSRDVNLVRIDAANLNLSSLANIVGGGDIRVAGDTTLTALENITLTGENDLSRLKASANNITLHDKNSLELISVTALESATISAGNGIGVGRIVASQLHLDAGAGQLSVLNSSDSTALNMQASQITLRAGSGVGAGNALKTNTAVLDVINSQGDIDIVNRGAVTLTNLVTQGDISLTNDLDVRLDRVDAGYDVGKFYLNVTNGSVFSVESRDYRSVADLTAKTAYINASVDVGTAYRPVSVSVNDEFALFSNVGSIYYFGRKPTTIIDGSKIKVSVFDALLGLSGQQLITVEPLAEIDPAIFTDVRNYSQSETSILLPKDQLYNEEDDEEDE